MAISRISSQSLISGLGYLDPNQTGETSDASSVSGFSGDASSTGAAQTSLTGFSQLGKLLSAMAKLSENSPDDFKGMAAGAADDFHAAAKQCGSMVQRLSLESMAAQFSNAALTGSMAGVDMSRLSTGMLRFNAYQNSLSMLDYLGSDQTTPTQVTDIISSNLGAILSK